jgi:hypothetical protein
MVLMRHLIQQLSGPEGRELQDQLKLVMLIGPIVVRPNACNEAYAQAAALSRRVKRLMGQLGEEGEFRQHLAQLRIEYKRKRNFKKLLEKFG